MTDKTEAPELKPCPFCGGEAEMRAAIEEAIIECTDCGLTMDHWDDSDTSPAEVCATRWNTRADQVAEVKALEWYKGSQMETAEARDGLIYHLSFNEETKLWRWCVRRAYSPEQPHVWSNGLSKLDAISMANEHNRQRILSVITTRPASEAHQEGYDAGQADLKGQLPWRMRDLQRGLILFRTSSNAHGYTNYSAKTEKIDGLPQAARDELAAIMTNMAIGYSRKDVKQNGVIQQWIEEAHAAGYAQALEDHPVKIADLKSARDLWNKDQDEAGFLALSNAIDAICALSKEQCNG